MQPDEMRELDNWLAEKVMGWKLGRGEGHTLFKYDYWTQDNTHAGFTDFTWYPTRSLDQCAMLEAKIAEMELRCEYTSKLFDKLPFDAFNNLDPKQSIYFSFATLSPLARCQAIKAVREGRG